MRTKLNKHYKLKKVCELTEKNWLAVLFTVWIILRSF